MVGFSNGVKVRMEDFQKYQEKYGNSKLDRWNRIVPVCNKLPKFLYEGLDINEELFNGTETEYDLSKNGNYFLITFITKKGNKYRFDLMKEPNVNTYHLGFSEAGKDMVYDDTYHDLTDNKESFEVFSKLCWILKNVSIKLNIHEFCIGATGIREKDRIYQYMMKFVNGWEKRNTTQYNLGWALYFSI